MSPHLKKSHPKKSHSKKSGKQSRKKSIKKKLLHVEVPPKVKKNARFALNLKKQGFSGGTETGINRAKQLSMKKTVDVNTLKAMRIWFHRHSVTSRPGYKKFLKASESEKKLRSKWNGAIAWLLWGGEEAYKWIASKKIQDILKQHFPTSKKITLRK